MTRTLLFLPGLVAAAALTAACAPEEDEGIPITGTLNSAVGPAAPLTLDVGTVVGSGFSLDAVLDGVPVTGSGSWSCYAPLLPDYPNYDIEATDSSTFGLFISVKPEVWSTGAHPIDDAAVRLLVAAPDRFGVAMSGTIFLSKAGTIPDTAGNDCGFSASGLVLEGEKDR